MKRIINLCVIGLFALVTSKSNTKIKINQGHLNNATNTSAHYKVVDFSFGAKNDSLILPWMNKNPIVKQAQANNTDSVLASTK